MEPRNIAKDLKHVRTEPYTPMGLNRGKYKIQIGFAKEAPNADAQGFNLYHRNRLIKPMWEARRRPPPPGPS